MASITTTIGKVSGLLETVIQAGLMPMLHGSPGIGKSAIFHQLAETFNLFLIDIRLAAADPTDLNGFPMVDLETKRSYYCPMEMFPLEGDPVPAGYDGWLIVFDEVNHADRSTEKAAYKVFYDRMIGARKIHPQVAMVAAGNLASDNAHVEEMSTAMQSRMVHFEVTLDPFEFIEFAEGAGFHHYITDFIKFKPDMAYTFSPTHTDKTYGCPRTWDKADRMMKIVGPHSDDLLILLSGAVSEGVAREFIGFIQVYAELPSIDEIINAPVSTVVPSAPGTRYALTGSLAHNAKAANMDKILVYVDRLPIEFRILTMRAILKRGKEFTQNPDVMAWTAKNANELF